MLDEIFEEPGRKPGFEKRTSYKKASLKHLRSQRQNPSNNRTHNVLSPVKTSPVSQPLSVTGLSAASFAQLNINPQLITQFSASTGLHYHMDKDSQSTMLQRHHEVCDMRSQEKVHQLGEEGENVEEEEEDTSGIYKEPGQRTAKSREASHLRSEEVDEAEGLHDIEKVMVGRKASKKQKSK